MSSKPADDPNSAWPWPDSLDAVVAAPDFHKPLFENPRVRVLHTRIAPGQRVPLHTHRWPSVQLILSWGSLIRRDQLGNVTYDTRQTEAPQLNRPLWLERLPPHTVENVGDTEFNVILVEIKDTC